MDAEVIDLVALGAAARPLAEWWEQFCATGQADVSALDCARKQLAGLCELPGRMGQAIRLVVRSPLEVPPVALTMAVEFVATTARRCPTVAAAVPRVRRTRRRAKELVSRHDDQCQLVLPGLDGPSADASWLSS